MTMVSAVSETTSGVSVTRPPTSSGLSARLSAGARTTLWTVASLVFAVAVWQLIHLLGGVSERVLPAPSVVAREVWQRRALLWSETMVTLKPVLLGFGASVVIGTVIGVVIAFSRLLERLIYPLLVISQAVPKVALVPILIIWFGLGSTTHAVLAFSVAVFPVVINSVLAFREIDPDYLTLGRSMGASRRRLFVKIRMPFAIPTLFAGYKVAITMATVGAIVGELVAGNDGLGYLAQAASGNLQTELTFAAIVAMSALGIVLFYAVLGLEQAVLRLSHLREDTPAGT